jgi:hypothetical protein
MINMNDRRILGFVSVLGLLGLLNASAQGPDEKGAVLRNGFESAAPQPAPPRAAPMDAPRTTTAPATVLTPEYLRSILNSEDNLDINRDIQVTPAAGNWLIMVISYPGKDGPMQARKMALELRSKNRIPAYVFVFGAEERRKENERVKKIIEQQKAFYQQNNLTPDHGVRVRHQQIDVQHAVLIGGYGDDEAAKKALETIKKWDQPDEKKVDLEVKYYRLEDGGKGNKKEQREAYYVNPFKRAFVCRNPTVKQETQAPKMDVAALRQMNADEPYSLFHCKKPFTLAVKEFQTPYMMQDKTTTASIWDKVGGFGKTAHPDHAKISAHNLAETLRKVNLADTYVLHSKYSSSVTVGSFESADDPALKMMQDKLADRFNQAPFTQIQFFHRPVPMAVPR